jgi:PhzF family phenazine biosynthesis protein
MNNIIYQVDAFTRESFKGNPAGVYISDKPRSEEWMRGMAREMNLSETAFLVPTGEKGEFNLRWFTPKVEVSLCGHATLSSAHILWEQGYLDKQSEALFHTLSGLLTARLTSDGWIVLDFPAKLMEPSATPEGLLESLQISEPKFVGLNKLSYLVEVDDEETVRNLAPDHGKLRRVNLRSVVVTARSSTPEYDFVSRFFAPGVGIDEDPVTGSAHTALTPYWAKKLGKKEMTAYQASARGGILKVVDNSSRVEIHGQALTVFKAELSPQLTED